MSDLGHADVLVVGSGASGAAAAYRLATRGWRVVCLEQGGPTGPRRYATDRPDWEVRRQREWNPYPNARSRDEDYPVDDAASPIKPLMFNGVGGSTIMWSAHFPRFHPSDFRTHTLDGVGDDWPLTYEELAPYYEQNDRVMGIAGISGDPANPPREPRQTPPVPLGRGGELLAGAFDTLGWHWWPSDVAINTVPYGDGRGGCNNCGPCEMGCPIGAKASTDITYWPEALRHGAVLRTHARVSRLTTDAGGRRVTGAVYLDADGVERHQSADVVMLAANGVGTPRLLLLSASPQHPDGLANSSGLVGRRLMFHPIAAVTGVFDEPLEGYRGITACSILSQEFYETDCSRGFVRGYELQVLRHHGPLMTALGGFATPVSWGEGHQEELLRRFDHIASLAVTAEDLPDEANTVTLDDDLVDSSGLPAPRLRYRIDDNARRILAHGIDRSRDVLAAAGAGDTLVNELLAPAGFHLMGTARMGEDPATSVTDRWGRAHDTDNLFIIDGSLFVTAAAVNPTPTIQALALRAADRVGSHAGP